MSGPTLTDSDIDQHVKWFTDAFRNELLEHVPSAPHVGECTKVKDEAGGVRIELLMEADNLKPWGCYLRLRGPEAEDYSVAMRNHIEIQARHLAQVCAKQMFYAPEPLR